MKNPLIAGILVIVLLISFILSCGCISQETPQSTTTGGSMATPVKNTSHLGEPVDLNMQFEWDKNTGNPDVLIVSGTTNIPDGAGLWCSAYEGTNPDEYDSKFATASDPSIVKGGKFSCTLNLYDGGPKPISPITQSFSSAVSCPVLLFSNLNQSQNITRGGTTRKLRMALQVLLDQGHN